MISTYSSGGLSNTNWTGKSVLGPSKDRNLMTRSADWKNTLASVMYFIPDFDETDGYYGAASGVSVHAWSAENILNTAV